MTQSSIISTTRLWLNKFIIAYSICPFAKPVSESGRIRYRVISSRKAEDCLIALIAECQHLDINAETATTLLIIEKAFQDFDQYLDLLAIAEQLLIDQGYEGVYQLASFHPHYCFAGSEPDDPANYTNRSPYPMLHIIREADIEQVLKTYDDPQAIPERNIELTRRLGLEKLRELLNPHFE